MNENVSGKLKLLGMILIIILVVGAFAYVSTHTGVQFPSTQAKLDTLEVVVQPEDVKLAPKEVQDFYAYALNGTSPFTFYWEYQLWYSDDDNTERAYFSNTNSTPFAFKNVTKYAILFCTVTDAEGSKGYDTVIVYDPAAFTISSGFYPGAPSFTVGEEDDTYYAKNAYGAVSFTSTNASEVIQDTWDNMPQGSSLLLKEGNYPLSVKLNFYSTDGNCRRTVEGEGWGTILTATSSIDTVIDFSGASTTEGITISNLQVDANSNANYCFYSDYEGGLLITLNHVWARRANVACWASYDTGSVRFNDGCQFNYCNGDFEVEINGGTDFYSFQSSMRRLNMSETDYHMAGGNMWYAEIGDLQNYAPTFDYVWFENPIDSDTYMHIGSDSSGFADRVTVRNCIFNRDDAAFTSAIKVDYARNTRLINNQYNATGALTTEPTDFILITSNANGTIVEGWKYIWDIAKISDSGLNTKFVGVGFENSGTQTCANGEDIAHGLAGTPTSIHVDSMNATYDNVPVIVSVNWASVDSANINVGVYWTNGTAITDDAILVSWSAKYTP